MKLIEIEMALEAGKTLRNKAWDKYTYIQRIWNEQKQMYENIQFHRNYTVPFGMVLFSKVDMLVNADQPYEIIELKQNTKEERERIFEKLKAGKKLTKPYWKNSYIYLEQDYEGNDQIRVYWKRPHNVYDEPFVIGYSDDLDYQEVSNEEARKIWGYYESTSH